MDFWRQIDILPPSKLESLKVTLIGAGGIGSMTGIVLAKMGVPLFIVYDSDRIEIHNLPNTMYEHNETGSYKAQALCSAINKYGQARLTSFEKNFDGEDGYTPVMISGVDSMKSRVDIWQKVKFNTRVHLYIDGRMGGQTGIVYALNPCDPSDIKKYEGTLNFTDEEAVQEACTNRAIIYNTAMIASLIAHNVRQYAMNERVPFERMFDFPTDMYMVR